MSGTVSYSSDTPELRATVITTALAMNAQGINQGKSGNVSVRVEAPAGLADPCYLITPTAIPYDLLQPADIVHMRGGEPAAGGRQPSSEWRFHRDIFAARPEVQAIVHSHAVYCSTLACLRRGIPSFHYMVAMAGGHDIRCADYATFGTQALSDHALRALEGRRACLLANHGLIATGVNLRAALALAVEVETLARIYWQALQVGEPVMLSADQMDEVLVKFGGGYRA